MTTFHNWLDNLWTTNFIANQNADDSTFFQVLLKTYIYYLSHMESPYSNKNIGKSL